MPGFDISTAQFSQPGIPEQTAMVRYLVYLVLPKR
jgi:hypothetical protein